MDYELFETERNELFYFTLAKRFSYFITYSNDEIIEKINEIKKSF